MTRIDVTKDDNRFKVMVNFETRCSRSSVKLANQEAKRLKDVELPSYEVHLIEAN